MRARGNWTEVEVDEAIEVCHFIFRPVNFGYSGYNRLNNRLKNSSEAIIFNHFENLRGMCTKSGLVKSLKDYYKSNREAISANYSAFDTTPTSFLISF